MEKNSHLPTIESRNKMKNNKTKIVIGTSQLGWNLNLKKKKKLLDVIKYSLERKISLHISTLYGDSIDIISKNFYPISNYDIEIFLKVDFENKEVFYHQVYYAIKKLGIKDKLKIQIENSFDLKDLKELNIALNELNNFISIDEIYFSPIGNNSNDYINFFKDKKFNIAIQFSLIERELDEKLIDMGIKILSLRSFGKGLSNFEFPDYNKKNIEKANLKRDELYRLTKLENISEKEARLKYILNHPKINYCTISTSKISHLEEILKIEKENFQKETWKKFDNFSKKNSLLDVKIKHNPKNYKYFYKDLSFFFSLLILKDLKREQKIETSYILQFICYLPKNILEKIKKLIYNIFLHKIAIILKK